MLKSLYIQNYRCLDSLRINQLKRVNLITGKNNTGKSSVLEAMVIYASSGDKDVLLDILESHGEYVPKTVDEYDKVDSFKLMSSLFTNREVLLGVKDSILIGDFEEEVTEELVANKGLSIDDSWLLLQFLKPIKEEQRTIDAISEWYNKSVSPTRMDIYFFDNNIQFGEYSFLNFDSGFFKSRPKDIIDKYQFIKTSHIDRDENGVLFDNITLTEYEDWVVEALQIVEPKVERIALVQDNKLAKYRVAKVKLKDIAGTVPLRSMGDGINRILTIILALINSKDGYLMIDEFENGLHYSVQKKLWDIILKLSKELNVQVFATTHSNDSIGSLRDALSALPEDEREDATAIKLMRTHEGKLDALVYDYEELDYVIDQDIEIR